MSSSDFFSEAGHFNLVEFCESIRSDHCTKDIAETIAFKLDLLLANMEREQKLAQELVRSLKARSDNIQLARAEVKQLFKV